MSAKKPPVPMRPCMACGQMFRPSKSAVSTGYGKSCSRKCIGAMQRSNAVATLSANTAPGTGGCLLWTACRNERGYGALVHHRKAVLAHRLSYQVNVGPIPAGMCVCHRCDTPACVNPAHLFLGTHADNMADKVSKRRQSRGESHGKAKMTEAQVLEMRALHAAGETQKGLAARFGVSKFLIHCVVSGKTWKHLQGAAA